MKHKTTFSISALIMLFSLQLGFGQDGSVSVVHGHAAESFFSSGASGNQDISKLPKMDRDIYILQNIMDDLFKGDGIRLGSRKSKGIYIPNNGVIFNISGNNAFGFSGYQSWDELSEGLYIRSDGQNGSSLSKEYSDEELDKLNNEKEKKLTELSKIFLSNYGSLLGELKDNEKIQISVSYSLHVKSSSRRIDGQLAFVSSSRDQNKRKIVSVVSVKDVKAYETGKLSKDEMFSRIESKSSSVVSNDMADAKILAGIFDDLFKTTYDGYLNRSGRTNWTYFEGFGVMYDMNLSSSSNGFSLKTTDEGEVVWGNNKSVKSDEFYKDIQSKYDAFESAIKTNIIKYARTLRSLKPNEVVIVNVGIRANNKSKLPKTLQFMIPKSAIDAYAKGQKSLEQIKDEVSIKKLSTSVSGSSYGGTYSIASYPQRLEAGTATTTMPVVTGTLRSNK